MAMYNNEGPVIKAETICGNVDISCVYNKNSILLAVPDPIPQSINFRVELPECNFTGRLKEMEKLDELSSSTNAVKVVIAGMGGVGKTQIARKFIEENRSKYANVIWINSETEQDIIDAFKKLSEDTLQLSTINANGKEKDFSTVIEQVLQKLCQRKTLIVYDNVDSIQRMNVVLAMAPPPTGQKPHVFITSRLQRWRTGIIVMLLDFWSPAEAFQFISKALNDAHYDTDDDRNLLANTMQYFPLALRQATAYINQQRVFDHFKISQYVSEYMRNRRQMLQSKIFQTDSYSPYQNTTYSTWSITIDTIRKVNLNGLGQLAIRIFNVIAYFQPDLIERKWFFHLNFDDENQQADQKEREERLKSAVDILIKYCMIDSQDKQESFNVHRLVQEVTKFNLKELHEEESVLRDALQLISNIDTDYVLYAIRSHAISVFMASLSHPDLVKQFSSLSLLILRDMLFFNTDTTKQFGGAILEPLKKILGANDRVVLKLRYYVARSYTEEGDYQRALEIHFDVVEKQKTQFGEHDPDTLQTQCQIASLYHRLGNANASLRLYKETLDIQKRFLGNDHPDTLQTEAEIALHSSIVQETSFIRQFMQREGLL